MKKSYKGLAHPQTKNITPNCLKVDKAITFFISNSKIAAAPAIVIVNKPRASNHDLQPLSKIK